MRQRTLEMKRLKVLTWRDSSRARQPEQRSGRIDNVREGRGCREAAKEAVEHVRMRVQTL